MIESHTTTSAPTDAIPAGKLDEVIGLATRAPSVHNMQPWRFVLMTDGTLELRVDPTRSLAVADPRAREVVISCGAALLNARLALRGLGLQPVVDSAVRVDNPLALARVRVRPGPVPTADELTLLAAIPRRHTHRGGFTGLAIDATMRDDIAAAAAVEGGWLRYIDRVDVAEGLGTLARMADTAQHADPDWRVETARWTPPPASDRRDGVPPTAYAPARVVTSGLPPRDFSLGREWGWVAPDEAGSGTIAVLLTDEDHVDDWLRAGQALQRALLLAASRWVFATFATQPLEVPHIREAVRDLLGTRGFPQMVLELGHAHSAAMTPRRPADDVIDRE